MPRGQPLYITVPDSPDAHPSNILYGDNLRLLPNADRARTPSLLQFIYGEDGDKISVTVIAFYGKLDPHSVFDSTAISHLTRETLGTWSAGLNQSIHLDALARVGVAPVTLTIVTALPEHPWWPETISKAPSLQMDYAPDDREFSLITIHNFSRKPVIGVRITAPMDDGSESTSKDVGLYSGIAPGKAYEMRLFVPGARRKQDGSWIDASPTSTLVLEAAIFADGSYEGDPQIAAEMDAREIGDRAEAQRLNILVAPILADTKSSKDTSIARILDIIDQLPITPDAQMIARLRTLFPDLSQQDLEKASQALSRGMSLEKSQAEFMVRQFQTHVLPRHPNLRLAQWWSVAHPN